MLDMGYTTAGWNCAFCGAFVGHGDFHGCGGYPSSPTATVAPVVMNRDNEIIDLLKRIVELLEQDKEKT